MAEQPLTYRDMAIEMTDLRADGSFTVRLYGKAPNGRQMRADEAERPTYVAAELRVLLSRLALRTISQNDLRQFGAMLGNLMLPGELRKIFEANLQTLGQKGEGLRLRLRIEPLDLAALPWEFALVQSESGESQPTDFLAWRRNVSVTRYETLGSAVGPLPAKQKLRIVAALANPRPAPNSLIKLDDLKLEPDKAAIEAAIRSLPAGTHAVEAVVLEGTTRRTLIDKVRQCDIFHFAGHGLFARDTLSSDLHFRTRGDIALETEGHDVDLYPSDQLASVLGDAGVRLVVLGACNSASRDENGAWAGVAPALVRERIPAVVAMQYKLLDATSAAFMPPLYSYVLKGYTIDEAVYEGRKAIFSTAENWAEEGRDWGVPVLYLLAEGGELFTRPADVSGSERAPENGRLRLQSAHPLPAPPADFTGRGAELADLRKTIADGAHSVGLRGMGGTGKTALALVLAHELSAAYPDAQLLIEMRGLDTMPTSSRAAAQQVVRAFEGPEATVPDDWAELRQRYYAALNGKKALLVFDNARDDQQLEPLLPPLSCLVLVTSRHACYLPGLVEYPLGALNADDARALLLRIAPRIGAEAEAIAMVCARLPLALALAGKWAREHRTLAPGGWLTRCQDVSARLKLTGMDAALQVSYEALRDYADADLQAAWRTLAVFPGTFDVGGAAAVWGLWEGVDSAERAQAARETAEERISALDNTSLVEYDAESGRYSLHDLAREFARRKMDEDELEAAGRKHAEYYIQVLANADDLYIDGNEGISQGLVMFDRERENIEAGQAWAAAHAEQNGATAELSERYCGSGWSVLSLRLNRREHIRWLEQALAAARYLKDQRTEATHLGSLGEAYAELGETRRAIEYHGQALAIVKALKIWYGEVRALGNLGSDYNLLGEPLRAIDYLEKALVIARGHRDQRGEGNTLGKLGDAFANLREPRRAIEYYEQALAINREIPDKRAEGTILGSLGIAHAALGEPRRAIEFYEQHLAIARVIGDRRGQGAALWNMALALDKLGEREKATANAEAALQIREDIEDPNAGMVQKALQEWKAEARA